jgi:hypothetical protein
MEYCYKTGSNDRNARAYDPARLCTITGLYPSRRVVGITSSDLSRVTKINLDVLMQGHLKTPCCSQMADMTSMPGQVAATLQVVQ